MNATMWALALRSIAEGACLAGWRSNRNERRALTPTVTAFVQVVAPMMGSRPSCARLHPPRFQTVITPSEEASQRHLAAISQRLSQLRSASQAQVIEELNPLIDGWAAYNHGVVEATTLSKYDELVEQLLLHWARGRHPTQGSDWLLTRYWRRLGEQARVFATPEGTQLRLHRRPDMPRESQQKEPVTPADGHLQQGRQNFTASPVMQQTTDYLSAQEGQDGADNRGEAAPSDRDHPSNQAAEKDAAPSSWL